MTDLSCTLLIIGGGPGGYVAGIRAGQLGVDTLLVEVNRLGGTCLNIGCIPSKALIHAAEIFHTLDDPNCMGALGISLTSPAIDLAKTMRWKDEIVGRLNGGVAALLKKHKVRVLNGRAEFIDGKTIVVETDAGPRKVRAEHVIIATGSEPVEVPALPFGDKIISSTGALSLEVLPKALAVVGAGYIGLELGIAFAKMGSAVTVVEAEDRVLPAYDRELTNPVARRLEALGVKILTGAKAQGLSPDGGALVVLNGSGGSETVAADNILISVGRRARTRGFGLERLDLAMNGPFLEIDGQCGTSMRGVWAVGDVTGEPMLAHRAMAQGEMVAEIVAGHRRVFDKRCIPSVCFTDPEVVVVGLSPDDARAAGYDIQTGLFPFRGNGRAMTKLGEDGFVRVVARKDNHVVLGVQAVGQGVSELSAAFGLAIEMGARLEDIAGTIHAHPTQGEAFQEAALKALGHALHI